ncbi:hypothetical protein [Microbacterium sp.]|uniref:hypothetical protein n=1 Tax=Microbacterium sp. TaxID=51671 RepID=UPI003A92498A
MADRDGRDHGLPLPGITATKPGSAQVPIPGISIDVVDDDGNEVGHGNGGLLVITEPWPSMLRGIWGDPERFKETYWEKFQDKGYYLPATAPGWMTMVTCGCSAAWTTS